jgi:ribosome-interacting GTPase 1
LVTNLPPQAVAQYRKVMGSRTPEEKLQNLKLYLSMIPRHKGTEKLQRQVRRQISELEEEIGQRRAQTRRARTRKARQFFARERDSPLVALVGRAQSGKSTLLAALTSARPHITGLPFATQRPEIGAYHFDSVVYQVVELPAIRAHVPIPSAHAEILRGSDLIVIVIDLQAELGGQMRLVEELRQSGIALGMPLRAVRIERRDAGGISVIGTSSLIKVEELLQSLRAEGMDRLVVRLGSLSTLDDVLAAVRGTVVKPTLLIANKLDAPGGIAAYGELAASFGKMYRIIAASALTGSGIEAIGRAFLSTMGLMRVFTKLPSEDVPSQKPILIREGATVAELAETIHRELARALKYARVWRSSRRAEGLRVGPNFVLEDMDAIELRE